MPPSHTLTANWPLQNTVKAMTIALDPILFTAFANTPSQAPKRTHRQSILTALSNQIRGISWLQLTHENKAVKAQAERFITPRADACYTTESHLACAVTTGDCLPIAVANHRGTWAAMVHAGWRGLYRGILPNTLMHYPNPSELVAWIGPHICASCYEVGPELRTLFTQKNPKYAACFASSKQQTLRFDLYQTACMQLRQHGIRTIYHANSCTLCTHAWYSYRRSGPCRIGGNVSMVWLQPSP